MIYEEHIASLPLTIDDISLKLYEQPTSSGFTRTTTEVQLTGDGNTGYGEDVTYTSESHYHLQDAKLTNILLQDATFDSFSNQVNSIDLFFNESPEQEVYRNYRQWGFESAALDLALRQQEISFGECIARTYRPISFVVSTRLGDPPSFDRIARLREMDPTINLKLDPTSDWEQALIDTLADTHAVKILDFKGLYENSDVEQAPNADLYQQIIDRFPNAILEDPGITDQTRDILTTETHRISWDYPITDVDSITERPWKPTWINIKPSRFGSVKTLFDTIEYCQTNRIKMYGGGQFELSIGRSHLHHLASLFYPDGPNDVAPREYNEPTVKGGLQTSPIDPPTEPNGFSWTK